MDTGNVLGLWATILFLMGMVVFAALEALHHAHTGEW